MVGATAGDPATGNRARGVSHQQNAGSVGCQLIIPARRALKHNHNCTTLSRLGTLAPQPDQPSPKVSVPTDVPFDTGNASEALGCAAPPHPSPAPPRSALPLLRAFWTQIHTRQGAASLTRSIGWQARPDTLPDRANRQEEHAKRVETPMHTSSGHSIQHGAPKLVHVVHVTPSLPRPPRLQGQGRNRRGP
jgi:hypothetical protein